MRKRIGVLGATSPVGVQLTGSLIKAGHSVVALSRTHPTGSEDGVEWINASGPVAVQDALKPVELWISVAPIWVLENYFELLQRSGIKKIVVLSSTSRFTKTASSDSHEARVVQSLVMGEDSLQRWAEVNGIQWVVLRPTLIYGYSTDRNLSEIVRMIRKFKFFPLLGPGRGLRQPIYVDDVATACIQAGLSESAANKAYNISGAEVIAYNDMVTRVFDAMGLAPRFVRVNPGLFKIAIGALRLLPRYRRWSFDMADRMSKDMIFQHDEATQDFGFTPQAFTLLERDIR